MKKHHVKIISRRTRGVRFAHCNPVLVQLKQLIVVFVLITTGLNCQGQVSTSSPTISAPGDRERRSVIVFEWDRKDSVYYYTFYNSKGQIVKKESQKSFIEKSEFFNLAFPVEGYKEWSKRLTYNLTGLPGPTLEEVAKETGLGNIKNFKQTEKLFFDGVGFQLIDIIDNKGEVGKYLCLINTLKGFSGSDLNGLGITRIEILDCNGKSVVNWEKQGIAIGRLAVSNNLQYVCYDEDANVSFLDEGGESANIYIYDLKLKTEYKMPLAKYELGQVVLIRSWPGELFNIITLSDKTFHIVVAPNEKLLYLKIHENTDDLSDMEDMKVNFKSYEKRRYNLGR